MNVDVQKLNSIIFVFDIGPVHMTTQSVYFVSYCSEKLKGCAEGLRSDGNASNKTVSFQKMKQLKRSYEKWNDTQSFRSRLNR